MLTYAKIAQDKGVEMLGFRMWPGNLSDLSKDNVTLVNTLAKNLLADIRKIYTGKIAIKYYPYAPDMDLFYKGDFLAMSLWGHYPWKLADSKDASSDKMYNELIEHLDNELLQDKNKYGKNIIFEQIATCSYDGAKMGDPDFETQSDYFKNDPNISIDLKEQANGYEAFLKAISERTEWIQGAFSFGYNYRDGYDKEPSVRSKPAEKILSKWYGWIKGEDSFNSLDALPTSLEAIEYSDSITQPNPNNNLVSIYPFNSVLVQPLLKVDSEDIGKKADLLMYIF